MFKEILNSNISVNQIKTQKKWKFSTISGDRVDISGSVFPVLEGQKIDSIFYPSESVYFNSTAEPLNWDGSYKRLIYNRDNFLYYKYKNNPFTTFGVINVDEERRMIWDRITSVNIPYVARGDRIVPNSVKILDYSSGGGGITIVDDGNSNLVLSKSFITNSSELSSVNDTSTIEYVGGTIYKNSNGETLTKDQTIEYYKQGLEVFVETTPSNFQEVNQSILYYDPQKERFGNSISSYGEYLLAGSIMDNDSLTTNKTGICSLYKTRSSGLSPIKVFRSPFQSSILSEYSSYEGIFIQTEHGDFILYETTGELCVSSSASGIFPVQDNFGTAVSIHGNFCAISSLYTGNCIGSCETGSGLVFCYEKNKGGPDNWGIINVLEGENKTDDFGKTISVYKKYMAVGAPGYSSNAGAVYIFKLKTYSGDAQDGTPTASLYSNQLLLDATGSYVGGTGSIGDFILETSPLIKNFWQPLSNKTLCGLSGSLTGIFNEYSEVPTFVSGSNTWMLSSIILGESGSRFGGSLSITDSSMVVGGDLVSTSSHAWFYVNSQSLSGSIIVDNWIKHSTLDRTDSDSLETYTSGLDGKNENSGFGTSVSVSGEYICVGVPFDRILGSGDDQYTVGSATIYKYSTELDGCGTSSLDLRVFQKLYPSDYYPSHIAYGFSCDVNGNNLIIGAPKRKISDKNVMTFNSDGKIDVLTEYSGSYDEYLGDAYVYSLNKNKDAFILNDRVSQKKLVDYPNKCYGYTVSIERDKFFVGSPLFSIMDTSSMYYNQESGSDLYYLEQSSSWENIGGDKMSGSVYVFNYNQGDEIYLGNVFYNTGTIILTNTSSAYDRIFKGTGSTGFEIDYSGEVSIYEHEYVVNIQPNEFNVSTNPSSLENNTIPYDINGDGIFDFNDVNLLMKYFNGDAIEADDISNDSYITLEQNLSWWENDILLTESGDALIASSLVVNSSTDKGRLTQSRYNKIKTTLVDTGLLNIDNNYTASHPLPIGVIDENDAKILWRYWLGKLTPDYLVDVTDDTSSRKYLIEIVEFLNKMTGRIKPYPSKKQMLLSSGSIYSENNGGIPNQFFKNYIPSSSLDLSGSYLSTYITGVGLYSGGDLVVVGKLGTPIKNILTHPLNISVKFDAF